MSKKINENLLYHFGNKAINIQEKERIRAITIKQYMKQKVKITEYQQF